MNASNIEEGKLMLQGLPRPCNACSGQVTGSLPKEQDSITPQIYSNLDSEDRKELSFHCTSCYQLLRWKEKRREQ